MTNNAYVAAIPKEHLIDKHLNSWWDMPGTLWYVSREIEVERNGLVTSVCWSSSRKAGATFSTEDAFIMLGKLNRDGLAPYGMELFVLQAPSKTVSDPGTNQTLHSALWSLAVQLYTSQLTQLRLRYQEETPFIDLTSDVQQYWYAKAVKLVTSR